MQSERSEKMSLLSEVEHVDRVLNDSESFISGSKLSSMQGSHLSSYFQRSGLFRTHFHPGSPVRKPKAAGAFRFDGCADMRSQSSYANVQRVLDNSASSHSGKRSFFSKSSHARNWAMRRESLPSSKKQHLNRVQVVNDFQSNLFDETLGHMDQGDLAEINQNISEMEREEQIRLRIGCKCDFLGVADGKQSVMVREIARVGKTLDLEAPLFSDVVKVFANQARVDRTLLVSHGHLHLLTPAPIWQLSMHLLDGISKVILSEQHECCVALKLRDFRVNGQSDHLVFETPNREKFLQFLLQSASSEGDPFVVEYNSSFSMLVDSRPIWFDFDDVQRCKQMQSLLLKTGSESAAGFLEVKKNTGLGIFRHLLKKSNWETKYCVLRGVKLYVYKCQEVQKPEKVITLRPDMQLTAD